MKVICLKFRSSEILRASYFSSVVVYYPSLLAFLLSRDLSSSLEEENKTNPATTSCSWCTLIDLSVFSFILHKLFHWPHQGKSCGNTRFIQHGKIALKITHNAASLGTLGLLFEELQKVLILGDELGTATRSAFLLATSLEWCKLFPSVEASYASTEKSLEVFRSAKSWSPEPFVGRSYLCSQVSLFFQVKLDLLRISEGQKRLDEALVAMV